MKLSFVCLLIAYAGKFHNHLNLDIQFLKSLSILATTVSADNFQRYCQELREELAAAIKTINLELPIKHLNDLKKALEEKAAEDGSKMKLAKLISTELQSISFVEHLDEIANQVQQEANNWNKYNSEEIDFLTAVSDKLISQVRQLAASLNDLKLIAKNVEENDDSNYLLKLEDYMKEKGTPALQKIINTETRLRQIWMSIILRQRF